MGTEAVALSFVPVRREVWEHSGNRVEIEIDSHGVVLVTIELLRSMMTLVGAHQVRE